MSKNAYNSRTDRSVGWRSSNLVKIIPKPSAVRDTCLRSLGQILGKNWAANCSTWLKTDAEFDDAVRSTHPWEMSRVPSLTLKPRNNIAADCSISAKFGTEFNHVTPDVLQTFKVKCQRSRSQSENVVWSPNYCSLLGNRGRSIKWRCQNLEKMAK